MKILRNLLILLACALPVSPASADIAVLVHGYLVDARTWYFNGVETELQQAGWVNGLQSQAASSANLYFTVNLPSMAPLGAQADWLKAAVDQISAARPGEPVTLIGHSAGGVAARLMLVRHGAGAVKHLITLASPHLGTVRSIDALDATDDSGMFGFVKEWFTRNEIGDGLYNQLQYSRPLLLDLLPARPGSLLFWLNQQPHPDIRYTSVIHGGPMMSGDLLVPAFSQDMNQVPALNGKSSVLLVQHPHELSPADGRILVNMLR